MRAPVLERNCRGRTPARVEDRFECRSARLLGVNNFGESIVNRIYRLVWSEYHHAFIPAPEIARRRGKRSGSGKALAGALVAGAVSLAAYSAGAAASVPPAVSRTAAVLPTTLPTAPQVTAGQASVGATGNQMVDTESTSSAAINWGSFNIGSSAGVTFVQPTSSSVVLNRVLSADPSQIYGSLAANGIIFLINPQGVLIGHGAEVNVGGLVASSLNLSDDDFLAGKWSFTTSFEADAGATPVRFMSRRAALPLYWVPRSTIRDPSQRSWVRWLLRRAIK
jgi:filamentous hemagglutinin family protein